MLEELSKVTVCVMIAFFFVMRDDQENQVEFCSVESDNMRNRGLVAFSGKA